MKEELRQECPHCGGSHVEYITRVTGFFSKVGSWNKGKIAELKDRRSAIEANRELVSDTATLPDGGDGRTLKLFWKEGCPRCPEAKALAKELESGGHKVEYYDVESSGGLAESSLYMVMATPTMIVVDGEGEEVESWRGSVPEPEEVVGVIGKPFISDISWDMSAFCDDRSGASEDDSRAGSRDHTRTRADADKHRGQDSGGHANEDTAEEPGEGSRNADYDITCSVSDRPIQLRDSGIQWRGCECQDAEVSVKVFKDGVHVDTYIDSRGDRRVQD